MGSSNSRLGLKHRFFSSLFCGAASSYTPIEVGDRPDDSSTISLQNMAPHHDVSISSKQQSTFGSKADFTSSTAENEASSRSSTATAEYTSSSCTNHSGNLELCSQQLNVNNSLIEPQVANTSLKFQPPTGSHSTDALHTSLVGQDTASLHSDEQTVADVSIDGFTPDSGSDVSGSLETSQQLPRFHLSVGDQVPMGMGMILVDVVSIHSNILSSGIAEISNRETRRNSRRMFGDFFSRNSFRRNSNSPSIVFTTSHADDLGSHDRWLLDYSGDLHYDGIGRESRYSGTRSDHRSERLWQSRYEMLERFRDFYDEQGWQGSLCATGRHPRGTCSCESSSIAEESSRRASISQIIMLADALFEVLEEVHRHRMSFSLSMLNLPAPEAVVNSFLLKDYKKSCGTESGTHDVQQCNICLVDYEEGDKIRALPCSHEYHMSCVDKWLKEVHGVCPLCRDDVCKGVAEGSASNPEIPSL
ncbi:hypothetical protein JCGZ_14672 [Jatropha curcas]|uniref:RING-type domain-containing protein n=1 Tax=Jatropha curcas TaxID=180498 RepID=A0A067JY53_JATCU|nr:uncharacterized protein LOC105643260 [Jatropha curcas]KDP28901.1 hypothetical protein JCGZ_14672 [Jatropha curcas]